MRCYPFEPEKLKYPEDGLAPDISGYTMLFHHDGIYVNYVEKLNDIIGKEPRLKNIPLEKLIGSSNEDVRYYAGAVMNHEMYFSGLSPGKKEVPEELSKRIDSSFGSYERFSERFTEVCLKFRGSGYAWLCADMSGKLRIGVTTGQNSPDRTKLTPLLCCDLWEHAYYLDRQYRREEYIEAWLIHADWDRAADILGNGRRRG